MARIEVLDQITIDKIAAGEVIERPAAVVKELVENAIDANATSIVVEIKEGGIAFIRITDNGKGIQKEDIKKAFLRHATSKIQRIEDLSHVHSLGFRGEALSSISSVAQVELLTKCDDEEVGSNYTIHGGIEKSFEPAVVKNGTTFLVKQLFYNVPVRRKFLKTASTEASHIHELVTRLALSHPDVSFQFINNGSLRLHTSGNGNLKDIIYNLYGRDIANNLLEIQYEKNNVKVSGFIGRPSVSRGNRNYETYFINGRYVKSNLISRAIEEAYKGYAMQHRYPFTVLHIEMDTDVIDVNVHPTKMELRFTDQNSVYNIIYSIIQDALNQKNMILEAELPDANNSIVSDEIKPVNSIKIAESGLKTSEIQDKFTNNNIICKPHRNSSRYGSSLTPQEEEENLQYFMHKMQNRVSSYHQRMSCAEVESKTEIFKKDASITKDKIASAIQRAKSTDYETSKPKSVIKEERQLNMFEEHMIEPKIEQQYRLIGQVFGTYWMIEYKEELYIIDQHAAHEKVLYEKTMNDWANKSFLVQYISPPIVLTLSMQEKELLEQNIDKFTEIGFELETFGSDSYAIRGVPANLFSIAKKALFIEMLDGLATATQHNLPAEVILEKIASMSCKAAVKGNSNLSTTEVEHLISELLNLNNPFHCPHGRPTIISISKKEMEKKFKRIV